jgi:hypothetical protein
METILWTCVQAQRLIGNVKLKMDELKDLNSFRFLKKDLQRLVSFS